MRLFIAIDCSSEKEYFRRLQRSLPPGGVRLADDFHITLKFLGEVMPLKAKKVEEMLRSVKFSPFFFSLSSVGFFPDGKNPRVVWVGVEPKQDIVGLQKRIEGSLRSLFEREKRFEPHVTLARIKGGKSIVMGEVAKAMIEKKMIGVSEFRLMKSTLTPKGPVYEPILSVSAQPG